jgi:hypothetical protein
MVLSLIHTLSSSLQHVLSLLSLLCLHQLLRGIGFQQQTLPLLWVSELFPCLSCQLQTAKAHCDWTAAVLTAHQPTHFTLLYSTTLHSLKWTQVVIWYSLRADHIENTTTNSTSLMHVGCLLALSHCLFSDHCLPTRLSATLFPPYGYSSWIGYRHSTIYSFLEGCLWCLCQSCLPSPWPSSHRYYLLTAPLLRLLIPSSSGIRCELVLMYHHQYWSRVVNLPSLLLFWRLTPPQYPVIHFP